MPQPHKKRGRRMGGKKRKHEEEEEEVVEDETLRNEGSSAKRRKSENGDGDALDEYAEVGASQTDSMEPAGSALEKPFFGMLDEDEQEYFKRADHMLESNAFGDDEERALFLANVYKEADGKELKIAQIQSCSRLMERLIQLSTPEQLKSLFTKLSGNFIHLASHRFASHVCEALFLRAAPAVTDELLAGGSGAKGANGDAGHKSMERLFLNTLSELEGDMGFLLTDRYASHVLRVLLLVLSGEPVDTGATKHLLQSKRKEANLVQGHELVNVDALNKSRSVPDSFSAALERLITNSIAGLDTDKLRTLATHPNANPTLQLLLKLELSHLGKQRAKEEKSITRTLLPDDPITHDCESAKFISGLVYDPIGSHLVEQVVQHAPGKMFKSLYSEFFKERLASHARNEIAGYVACRVLERLGHDDLLEAHEILIPHVSDLLRKNRTMVVRTLIERCVVRDIDTQAIAVQVDATWHGPDGFEIKTLLKYQRKEAEEPVALEGMQPADGNAVAPWSTRETAPVKAHFNVLAQAMLLVPGSLSALVLDSLVGLDPNTLLNMAKDNIVSRTLQAALTTRNASMITTRKLIQHFYGHMGEMAIDVAASHVVDCIWQGTHGLAFIRERVAEELAENEAQLRESSCGRAVWKNWKMDLYKRRRGDWVKQSKIKASNDGFQSFAELDLNKDKTEKPKTAIELARERHAKKKSKTQGQGGGPSNSRKSRSGSGAAPPASGANATATAQS